MEGKESQLLTGTPEGRLSEENIREFVSQLGREEAILLGVKLGIVDEGSKVVDFGKLDDTLGADSSVLENLLPGLRAEEGKTAKTAKTSSSK